MSLQAGDDAATAQYQALSQVAQLGDVVF